MSWLHVLHVLLQTVRLSCQTPCGTSHTFPSRPGFAEHVNYAHIASCLGCVLHGKCRKSPAITRNQFWLCHADGAL